MSQNYVLPKERSTEVLEEGIAFLRETTSSLLAKSSPPVFQTVSSAALGCLLTGLAVYKGNSTAIRYLAGSGAALSGIYAGVKGLAWAEKAGIKKEVAEIASFLDAVNKQPELRKKLEDFIQQDLPHGVSPEGKVLYNKIVLGNQIIKFAHANHLIPPTNSQGALTLSMLDKGQNDLYALTTGMGQRV